jgi:hypothetical protein
MGGLVQTGRDWDECGLDPDSGLLTCGIGCTGGRPQNVPGLRRPTDRESFFAAMAQLEAASIPAFRTLFRELRHHGAPPSLQRAAKQAVGDEARHARVTWALSGRRGKRPRASRGATRSPRALVDVAVENVVEGCVRETFGALVATHQAYAAEDEDVRRTMARIAVDETRHAALAWRVDRWAGGHLSAPARERVDAAKRAAVRDLLVASELPPSEEIARRAGIPRANRARAMVLHLRNSLWC